MIYRGPGSSSTPIPPPSPVSNLSLFLSLPVCRRSSLFTLEESKNEVGEEPNHTTARKPSPLQIIQYSLTVTVHFAFGTVVSVDSSKRRRESCRIGVHSTHTRRPYTKSLFINLPFTVQYVLLLNVQFTKRFFIEQTFYETSSS
jgi:hypothetical protein